MKMKRIGLLLATCICSAVMLTGCSFQDVKSGIAETTHKIFGKTAEVTEDKDKEKEKIEKPDTQVDESVEKPEIHASFDKLYQITMGSVYDISIEASVSSGKISYQWYANNVNSNGGGTPIPGATDSHCTVDTSGPSHKFYYVVVTNEVNGKINRSTSETQEIIVWDIGTWQADENGQIRYMMIDGSYPRDTWFLIDSNMYYVNEEGHPLCGIVTVGEHTYYFSPEGYLQRNTTGPNGEVVDENGMVVSQPQPEGEPAPEQPAPEQPAEEAPAEAPAEEAPVEEAPAE